MINIYVATENFCCLQDFLPKPEKFMKPQICTTLIHPPHQIFLTICPQLPIWSVCSKHTVMKWCSHFQMFNLQGFFVKCVSHRMTHVQIVKCIRYNGQWVDHVCEVYKYFRPVIVARSKTDQCDNISTRSAREFIKKHC